MLSDLFRSHSELGPELRLSRASRWKPRSPADTSVPPCTSPTRYPDHLYVHLLLTHHCSWRCRRLEAETLAAGMIFL